MEPRHYLAVLLKRWPTLAVIGMLAVLGSAIITVLTPPAYTSTTSLLFSVSTGPRAGEVREDAQYVQSIIPSLVSVTTSAAVLEPVIAAEHLGLSTTELASTLTVVVVDKTTILQISAQARSPEQATRIARLVSQQLQVVTSHLSSGVAGPLDLLDATTIEPASEPRFPTSPNAKRNAFLAAVLGLMLGVLVALYRESVGAKINSIRDVAVLTDLPVWLIHPERGPSGRLSRFRRRSGAGGESERRSEDLRRLGLALDTMAQRTSAPADAGAPVSTVSPVSTAHLAVLRETTRSSPSSASSVPTIPLGSSRVLAVVEPGRTRRRALESLLSREGKDGSALVGVVLDGQSAPPSAGLRALLRRLREPAPSAQPTRLDHPGSGAIGVARSTVNTAQVALFLTGMALALPFGANTAFIASAALAPVWLPAVGRFRFASALLGLAVLALLYGFLLADRASVDHVLDGFIATETSLRFLGAFGTVGLILWARAFLPLSRIALVYGAGWLLTGLIQLPGTPNPWKFQLAFGVTFIVLGLVTARGRTSASVAAVLGLGLVSVLLDFRSWFAFCALTAGLIVWQARPRPAASKPASRLLSLLFLGALGVGSYVGATYAIVGGYLGDELQARSVAQIQASGSLIAGGRPEWTITWVLMQRNPLGFGVGVVPNSEDILAGKEGFSTVNVLFQPDYVDFLFGDQFKLHSMIADFWSHFGAPGLLLSLLIGGILLAGFTASLSRREASPLAIFLVVASMWDLAFQPIYSSLPSLALALGVVLWTKEDVSRKEWTAPVSSRSAKRRPRGQLSADPPSGSIADRRSPDAMHYASRGTS